MTASLSAKVYIDEMLQDVAANPDEMAYLIFRTIETLGYVESPFKVTHALSQMLLEKMKTIE